MDWTELSNRLAEGAKVYKAFEDGEHAASMLAGFERANTELSAKYEMLIAQLEQVKADIPAAQEEAHRARIQANQDMAQRWSEFEVAYAKRVAAAQVEYDGWSAKIEAQVGTYTTEATSWKHQIDELTSQANQLDAQIQSLVRVRDSLKAQLQRVL